MVVKEFSEFRFNILVLFLIKAHLLNLLGVLLPLVMGLDVLLAIIETVVHICHLKLYLIMIVAVIRK